MFLLQKLSLKAYVEIIILFSNCFFISFINFLCAVQKFTNVKNTHTSLDFYTPERKYAQKFIFILFYNVTQCARFKKIV